MIKFLRMKQWHKIIKKSNLFDIKYYLFTYSDVRAADMNPIKHYIKYGVLQGRNPSDDFNTSFYLDQYNDVQASGINPLVHYILYGKDKGFFKNKDEVNENKTNLNNIYGNNNEDKRRHKIEGQQATIIEKEFDAEYYLNQNPDVANSNAIALDHFCTVGWKEYRNPNNYFDTTFYLKVNPDVAASGINPFYHYLSRGRSEGRVCRHPIGYKDDILEHSKSAVELANDWTCKLPVLDKKDKLRASLQDICKKPIVISLSHDRYIDHIGGVQLCISGEQLALSQDGYSYINISPACPLPILAEDVNWHGDIIIDNEFSGTYKSEDILSVFKNILFVQKPSLVIHALHGHSVEFLKNLYNKVNFETSYYWIHDYFTACQNYKLLRNNLTYCGGPDVDSQACQICVYGGLNRKNHLKKIKEIFEYIPFSVIAPSQKALSVWLKTNSLSYQDTIVHAHRKILRENGESPIKLNDNEPLRIAFLGHDELHKGWFVFKELVEEFRDDKRYEFYHLGTNTHDNSCPAEYHEVKNNWENRTCMTDMISDKNIHISLLWSTCPETFSLVAYEALAAGSIVVTNTLSGNIAEIINTFKQGLVLDSEDSLFKLFKDGEIRKEIELIFHDHATFGPLESSNMTAGFINRD